MRKRGLPIAAAVAAFASTAWLSVPGAGTAGVPRTRDTDLQSPIAAGGTLEVRGVSGNITVTRAQSDLATIHAHAVSQDGDPAAVAIRMVRHDDRLIVCAVYPGSSCGGSARSGSRIRHDTDVKVDFRVAIPRGVALVAETVNGNITATALDAAVRALVVNGNITIATSGTANAQTVSGSIDATVGKLGGDESARLQNVNGRVHLTLPPGSDATIAARTVNGRIEGDGIPLSIEGGIVGSSAHATLGTGSASVSLETVSGSISVSRG
jgi:hypothetical protein